MSLLNPNAVAFTPKCFSGKEYTSQSKSGTKAAKDNVNSSKNIAQHGEIITVATDHKQKSKSHVKKRKKKKASKNHVKSNIGVSHAYSEVKSDTKIERGLSAITLNKRSIKDGNNHLCKLKDVQESKEKHNRNSRNVRNMRHRRRKKDCDNIGKEFPPLSQSGTNIEIIEQNVMPVLTLDVANSWSHVSSQIYEQSHKILDQGRMNKSQEISINEIESLTKLTVLSRKALPPKVQIDMQSEGKKKELISPNSISLGSFTSVLSSTSNSAHFQMYNKIGSTRLNVSRLRDRWWSIIRQQAIQNKKQQLLSISDSSSSSSISSSHSLSSTESHFFHLNPVTICNSTGNEKQPQNRPSSYNEIKGQPHYHSNLGKSDYPLHEAICNDDTSAIEHILGKRNEYQHYFIALVPLSSLPISKHKHLIFEYPDGIPLKINPLQLSVYLDKPNILKLLMDSYVYSHVSSATNVNMDLNKLTVSLLTIAVKAAFDGCVKVLLSHVTATKLNMKSKNESDTIFHVCCKYAKSTTLHLLLNAAGKGNIRTRILCSRNKTGQTPLHVACFASRMDIVQELLSTCYFASTKAYTMVDNDGFTPLTAAVDVDSLEIVALLLMWKGNRGKGRQQMKWKHDYSTLSSHQMGQDEICHFDFSNNYDLQHLSHANLFTSGSSGENCNTKGSLKLDALQLAVSRGSTEMVSLLIELSDPNNCFALNHPFRLNDALVCAIESLDDISIRVEMIKLLITAGANPYTSKSGNIQIDAKCATMSSYPQLSPIRMAARSGDINSLRVMLDSFDVELQIKQRRRRNHPHLQRQPEIFFFKKEMKENRFVQTSLSDALIMSLYQAWIDCRTDSSQKRNHDETVFPDTLRSSLFLLKRGAILDDASFTRLIISMSRYALGTKSYYPGGDSIFQVKYLHFNPASQNQTAPTFTGNNCHGFWSSVLCSLSWCWCNEKIFENVQCAWMREKLRMKNHDDNAFKNLDHDTCYLIIEGERLSAHKSILSAKSFKLAAAIRFAILEREMVLGKNEPVEIPLALSIKMTSFFIQHCYHGSISFGLSPEDSFCCHELFELALIAEEFLCPTLSLEVEMRLISSKPRSCFCWCCCNYIERLSSYQLSQINLLNDLSRTDFFFCQYSVFSPSSLINANTVLDILSLSQESFFRDKLYSIQVSTTGSQDKKYLAEDRLEDEWCKNEKVYHRPFLAVKAMSLKVLLQEFRDVLRSDGHRKHFYNIMDDLRDEYRDASSHSVQDFDLSILQTIMEELLSCSFPIKKSVECSAPK